MPDANENVLAQRYASVQMQEIWSTRNKIIQERLLWLVVLRAQAALGLEVPSGVIEDYEAVLDQVDLDAIAAREAVTRHDVKARIEEFCELAGHQHIHRGMTSRDLTENVEQLQIRQSLLLVRDRLVALLARFCRLALAHRDLVMVARTHNVAAQATTLGKRFADAIEETLLGFGRLEDLLERYPLRGVKGAVGTCADQLDLLGDADSVNRLEEQVAQHLGFARRLESVGQIYPRSLDLDVVAALVQVISPASSMATTLRLMSGHELASEGFSHGQVGSSAMPHKMNPRSAERISALRTILDGHLIMASQLAGRQWNEGDVSCSAVRRVMLPDAFFTVDGLLQTAISVLDGFTAFENVIDTELRRELPLLATSKLLTAAVDAGLGREQAHEIIKQHAVEAVLARRQNTNEATFVVRLLADERFCVDNATVKACLSDTVAFIGIAVNQVERVVARAQSVIADHAQAAIGDAEVRV